MNLMLQETELVVQKATNYWIMICFGALLARPSMKALILWLFSVVLLGGITWLVGFFFYYVFADKKVIQSCLLFSPLKVYLKESSPFALS